MVKARCESRLQVSCGALCEVVGLKCEFEKGQRERLSGGSRFLNLGPWQPKRGHVNKLIPDIGSPCSCIP
jgi:hypothetical protein